MFALELNKTNRLRIARAFSEVQRVDFSIDCVVEGQLGKVFVEDSAHPAAYALTIGPFWYFAGEPARRMMQAFPAYSLLMPSGPGWLELAQEIFASRLQSFPRYSFSAANLSAERLRALLAGSGYQDRIVALDSAIAGRMAASPESYLDLADFDSLEDFLERSFAFTMLDGETPVGVAYSSLVCGQGIEVSIFIEEPYRQKGIATALASRLLLECMQYRLRPNWDAANPKSCKLAQKLGYIFTTSYDAYYYTAGKE